MGLPEIPQQAETPAPPRRRFGRVRIRTAVIGVAVLGIAIGLLVAQPWQSPPLLAPIGVGLGAPTATTVQVSWRVAQASLKPDGFLVFRDGEQVASTPGTALSYVDHGLTPGSIHTYTVVATSGTQRSKVSSAVAVTIKAPAPAQVIQTGRDWTTVTLAWSPPPDAPAPDQYLVLDASNGDSIVGTVSGQTHSYTVTGLRPGGSAQYTVDAVWSSNQSADAPAVTAATRLPPLNHDYAVTYKTVSVPGGGASLKVGETWSDDWSFSPVCSATGCPTMRAVLNFDPPNYVTSEITMTLKQSGDGYVGTGTSQVTTCGGTPSTSILVPSVDPPTQVTNTIYLAVAPDKSSNGAWTAWQAVMQLSSPYTVHQPRLNLTGQQEEVCPAQSWDFTATGHPGS